MYKKTIMCIIVILLGACTESKTIEFYTLKKDLFYDINGGDGVGLISDLKISSDIILPKGTKISVTSQEVASLVAGTQTMIEVKILDGEFKGNEIYIDSIKNRDESLQLLKQ
ncbi:MAG: hypothetical protein NE328_13025 [Lentisphaeraceae bacterium]|nr:hypothetical protein [Lentisphaeraceae bacterium]